MSNSITVVKDWLTTNWNATNTDGRTPVIDVITNYKRYDLRDADTVFIYKTSGSSDRWGYSGIKYSDKVVIDCRSIYSTSSTTWQEHGQTMEDEVLRIVEGKKTRPANDSIWDAMDPIEALDLDDKGRETAKRVITVVLLRGKEVTTI